MEPTIDLAALKFNYTPPWEDKHDFYFTQETTQPDIDPQPTSITNNGKFSKLNYLRNFNWIIPLYT